jgi:hypothetical protein
VRLTPEAVATMICCLMATDNLSETAERVRTVCNAASSKRCRLTGEQRFLAALTKIISDKALASAVNSVHVDRDRCSGSISFYRGRNFFTFFTRNRSNSSAPISTHASLGDDTLRAVVEKLQGVIQ